MSITNNSEIANQIAADFMVTFIDHPDHVAVIVAISKMDEILGHLIRLRLVPCSTGKDELLDSGHGLGTFSNRIDLSFRLGLIDDSLARALHIFRKIRNDFAHAYEGQSLGSSPHKNRVEELNNRALSDESVTPIKNVLSSLRKELSSEKKAFLLVSVITLSRLERAKGLVKMLDDETSESAKFP